MADIQDTAEAIRIREVLKDHPHGLSIKEIGVAVAMSRNSVAKYLEVMTTAGQLDVRHVGNAKLFTLSRRVPVGDLFNHAKEMIIVLDNDLRVIQANGSFCSFAKIPRETALHARLSSLPFPLLSAVEEREMTALLGGGPTWKKEIHIACNGSDLYFEGRFIPTVLENNVPGVTLILEDITERTLAKRASRERDLLLQTLFQIPTTPQFFIDRNHKIVYWDRALEILTGVRAEEVIGTGNHWKAFYPAPRPCLIDLLVDGNIEAITREHHATPMVSSGADSRYECTNFFADLPTGGRWLHITVSLIRDTCGNLTGAMETIEDVTGLKTGQFVIQQ